MAQIKYLLSNGQSTSKVEEYILDLVDIYLKVNPGDIPHRDDLGMNFTLTNVMKDDLEGEISYRINSLVDKIKSRVPGVAIGIDSISLIDEQRIRLVLRVNGVATDNYFIDL